MNTPCEKCRALEFLSDGIRHGAIVSIVLSEPIYNCALNQKIILVNGKPHCNGECKEKTTRRGRE